MAQLDPDEFKVEASAEQLSEITSLALEQLRLEDEIASGEAQLKELKQQLMKIQQGLLPDALFAAGMSEFKTLKGDQVKVKEDLSVSVPKAKLDFITGWLEENGHGDIVTGKVAVDLPKNSHNERAAAVEALLSAGLEPYEDMTVNTATLKSILKKHLSDGEKIDLTEFGAFAWRKSEIKRA